MTIGKAVSLSLRHIPYKHSHRYISTKDIRNIGILAHIDAGKTTTTERMLFYSGKTRSLGEVHRGNTVTDYLTQERERGITICSSAVAFPWNNKKVNLLDTPGHIDFTMEVEQSLNAVDGVICVLDGTAGVEAQTFTVWSQANEHNLPKIVFVNKMDRPDADFNKCLEDLHNKLGAKIVCLQYPEKDTKGNLNILDIINLQRINWDSKSLGRKFTITKLKEDNEGELFNILKNKRRELIDGIADEDDQLADFIINNDGFDKVSNELIKQALRRSTCNNTIVPVLLGSAYKNVGIQSLLDAVIDYLPDPDERNIHYDLFDNDFVGKVFKIVHDKQRGPLTLVRVFRGELKKNMRLTSYLGQSEVASRLYEPLADEYREINSVQTGDVGICAGLKATITGDLLAASQASFKNAQKRLQKDIKKSSKYQHLKGNDDDEDSEALSDDLFQKMFSIKPQIPDAVYFCSIEPPSLSSQNAMELALKQLQREDPSLRVTFDAATGQTVLGGMGELHMEIIKSRILTEYKIDADLGPLQIAYRETIEQPSMKNFILEKEIAGNKQSVNITLELVNGEKEKFRLDKSPENAPNLNSLRPRILQIIKKGALSGLERGPRVGGEVIDTQIILHNVIIGRGTAESFVMAAAAQCVQKILNSNGTRLLEPMMSIQIVAPSERISPILSDLSRRRAIVEDVMPKGEKNKIIVVTAPLAELSGYSSILRTISSGTANMTMQPCGFSNMNPSDELIAIRRAQGLA